MGKKNRRKSKTKKVKETRDQRARRVARKEALDAVPVNKFLNKVDSEGNLVYPVAVRMRKYFRANPDPALNGNRLANSLVHEIRWHKDQAKRYLENHQSKGKVEAYDKNGKRLTKNECYTAHVQETQVAHTVVSKLRQHLIQGLLPTVDGEVFTMDQYNEYVEKVDKVVKGLGYDLFPDKVEMNDPK